MTSTEAPAYTVSPLDPTRGWVRPDRALSTLQWVHDAMPLLVRRVRPRLLSQSRYDSVMDLVANGLVERRTFPSGLAELRLTDLGRDRLIAARAAARTLVTGLSVDDGLSVDAG